MIGLHSSPRASASGPSDAGVRSLTLAVRMCAWAASAPAVDISPAIHHRWPKYPRGKVEQMEFGTFYEFPVRPGGNEADAFSEGFELIDDAERMGLDAFWLSESHCQPGVSVLAAPMTIASAIAGRTERMRIGLAV